VSALRECWLGIGAYGIEAVHGEDFDGRAAAALRFAADTFGGVHSVPGLRSVEHKKASAAASDSVADGAMSHNSQSAEAGEWLDQPLL
jgi:hypothetical protein